MGRRRRTLVELLIGIDKSQEQFDFLRKREEHATEQEPQAMEWEEGFVQRPRELTLWFLEQDARFREQELSQRHREHALLQSVIQMVKEQIWVLPATIATASNRKLAPPPLTPHPSASAAYQAAEMEDTSPHDAGRPQHSRHCTGTQNPSQGEPCDHAGD